jgi:hypothetical protein
MTHIYTDAVKRHILGNTKLGLYGSLEEIRLLAQLDIPMVCSYYSLILSNYS